ncbi:MAG: type II toxin-antitoxin system RelE/ParE family toxin [Halothiobacillus sp.]
MWEQSDYQTPDGKIPYRAWLAGLSDRQARARIVARVLRMKGGNFGDCKPMREGVWELRIDHGTGYRVYYARSGKKIILLLTGGDKRTQQTDISTAVRYWQDWQARNKI